MNTVCERKRTTPYTEILDHLEAVVWHGLITADNENDKQTMNVIGGDAPHWGPSRKMQPVSVVVKDEDEGESKIQSSCDSTDTLYTVNVGENASRPVV